MKTYKTLKIFREPEYVPLPTKYVSNFTLGIGSFGRLPHDMVDNSVKALSDLWNSKMTQAVSRQPQIQPS